MPDFHLPGRLWPRRPGSEADEVLDAQLELLARLARVAEYRDDDSGRHIYRVAWLSARLAAALGRSAEEVEELYVAAPLHDVGKVAVPDSILLKRGPLTAEEHRVMQAHTTVGGEMLGGSAFPYVRTAATIALTHHERWDGRGYPNGVAGAAIPLPGRFVAVADVFDALVSARPYKPAWSIDRALDEMIDQRGRHFDPEIVDALVAVVRVQGLPPDLTQSDEAVEADRHSRLSHRSRGVGR